MNKTLFFQAVSRFLNHDVQPDDLLFSAFLDHMKGLPIEGTSPVHSFIRAIEKCNYFVPDAKALAFRLNSSLLDSTDFPHKPFGLFYIFSEHFFGYHIRFQDLARGGFRSVISKDLKIAPTILTECYQLAWTQQKKNKDIPEGGAKAVLFLQPHIDLYASQKAFIESLLVLVNGDEKGVLKNREVVDLYKKPEYIYIGPDENMHDSMIEWIAAYAKEVGYKPGIAFISGKPSLGVNHKQYGVTSYGVNVFLDEVLRYLGFSDEAPFTVKMAGGPDGDVAGNEILNLQKYYAKRVKLTALIDVSGVIYDPMGVSLDVLCELFHKGLPIAHYPSEKLHEGGFLFDKKLLYRKVNGEIEAEQISEKEAHELIKGHIHRIPADIFIPAGGRPHTLQLDNVRDFLDEAGQPTARAIIEGANLYVSQEARLFLEHNGVLIIRDSTANKGGVISSSFEVLALLTMNEREFLADKEKLVQQILERIHRCCEQEAKLLLMRHKESGRPCSELSNEISEAINKATREEAEKIEVMGVDELEDFMGYQLPLLRERYREALMRSIPESHKKAIVATFRATRKVYGE